MELKKELLKKQTENRNRTRPKGLLDPKVRDRYIDRQIDKTSIKSRDALDLILKFFHTVQFFANKEYLKMTNDPDRGQKEHCRCPGNCGLGYLRQF